MIPLIHHGSLLDKIHATIREGYTYVSYRVKELYEISTVKFLATLLQVFLLLFYDISHCIQTWRVTYHGKKCRILARVISNVLQGTHNKFFFGALVDVVDPIDHLELGAEGFECRGCGFDGSLYVLH